MFEVGYTTDLQYVYGLEKQYFDPHPIYNTITKRRKTIQLRGEHDTQYNIIN